MKTLTRGLWWWFTADLPVVVEWSRRCLPTLHGHPRVAGVLYFTWIIVVPLFFVEQRRTLLAKPGAVIAYSSTTSFWMFPTAVCIAPLYLVFPSRLVLTLLSFCVAMGIVLGLLS
jgi:hypothetical protein